MIKKIKASLHEKLIFIFLIVLAIFALSFTIIVKNKCLFVKNFDPQKIDFEKPSPSFFSAKSLVLDSGVSIPTSLTLCFANTILNPKSILTSTVSPSTTLSNVHLYTKGLVMVISLSLRHYQSRNL